jgi:hypothetical protein
LIVAVIALLVPVVVTKQVPLLVSIQLITSLFAKVLLVYVVLFVPTLAPFFSHWYVGAEPPFVGVAVKITEVPEQMGKLLLEAIVIEGVRLGLTTIVILLEVAVVGEAQIALLVSTQVIISLLFKALSV